MFKITMHEVPEELELALKIIFYILSTLLGLSVGSFLNVCIYRLPRGNFFSKSRSFCPKCGTPIKAYDNIPLLSYIILRGKCRACHERISPRYPIIEAANMILWIVNFAVFGISYFTLIADVLVSVLIVVTMIDFDTTEIPDSSIITILILALLTFIPVFDMNWKSKLIGAFCVSIPMLIIAFFGAMGYGDVKLYFALGLLFGWEKMLIIFGISFIIGAIVGVINLAIIRHKSLQEDTNTDEEILTNVVEDVTQNVADIDVNIDGEQVEITNEISAENRISGLNNAENLQIDTISCGVNSENMTENTIDSEKINISNDTANDGAKSADASKTKQQLEDEEYERELNEKLAEGKAIPFGPFICIASLIALYFGDLIINGFLHLMGC